MKKMWLFSLTVTLVAVIAVGFLVFADDINHSNAEFLNGYGWIVDEEPIESLVVELPPVEDEIYREYNRLQREAGLNLENYYGKSGVRYTYLVLNYPSQTDCQVRANVLVVDGRAVAGDIMTVASDGFMSSLVYPR